MAGRRRLCKVSYSDDDSADKTLQHDESELSDLVDFDSPPLPSKNVVEIDEGGGRNEIRDILNELSSKFEILSIERPRVPKSVQLVEDSPALVRGKETWEDKAVDYASADSSFSPQQDPSDSSSDATKSAGGGIELVEDDSDDSVELLDHFDSENVNSITLSGPNSTYKLPGKIAKMLYPHQRDGLKWLWSLHCQGKGGILGDDMGLGKTMQVRNERYNA